MGTAYMLARRYNLPQEEAFAWKCVRSTAREALWAFLLPIIILGAQTGSARGPASNTSPQKFNPRGRALRN